MANADDTSETRDRFELYLRTYRPRRPDGSPPDESTPIDLTAYREYVRIKKDAMKRGVDPIRAFRGELRKMPGGDAKALKFWFNAIAKRIAAPEDEDVAFVRDALSKHNIDLDSISDLLGGDRRKIADIICALHLEALEKASYAAVYFIVDKLVSGAGGRTRQGVPPPSSTVRSAGRRMLMDEFPEDMLASRPDAYELLKKYGIDEWQVQYQADYDKATRDLDCAIAECTDLTKKSILQRIHEYYQELRNLEIPGIVDHAVDLETGAVEPFPAVHQKVGARFIASEKRVLIADDMGLGKTAQATIAKNLIDTQERKRTTAVVVVPSSIIQQWVREIKAWNKDEKTVVVVTSENKESSLAQAEAEKPDFVIVPYSMLSRASNGGTVGQRLENIADYLVVDESHKAKNESASRSAAVLRLSAAAKYVALLSGTPVPNRITDMGVVASILSGHKFTPDEFNRRYSKNPRIVREEILPHMLRRTRDSTFGRGRCIPQAVTVQMTSAQQKRHDTALLNMGNRGALELITELRRCALDPRLVGIDESSPKYAKLRELLAQNYDGTPQVVFSSELKTGVLDTLERELTEYGFTVARIDGDPARSGRNRERILADIKAGKYEVVLATLETLGEGINQLTVAKNEYFIDVPFTEAELAQGIARLDRKGQTRLVHVDILVSENSVDEWLLRMIEQKSRLGEFLIDGAELTESEREIIEQGESLVRGSQEPLRRLYNFFGTITNRRSADILALLRDPEISRYVAEAYWNNFEGSYYGNTMNLVRSIIFGLDGKARSGEQSQHLSMLDIASGPCCLARTLGRPVVSLDANLSALALGREKLGVMAGPAACGSFTDLPFTDAHFEVAVLSLALLHSRPDEREKILREANRVLRQDGKFIITLPSGEGRYERLTSVLPLLGFDIISEISGTARSADAPGFECVIICATKKREPPFESLPTEMFDFVPQKAHSENYESTVTSTVKKHVCTQFEIDGKDVTSAAEEVAASEVAGTTQETTPTPASVPVPTPESAPQQQTSNTGEEAQTVHLAPNTSPIPVTANAKDVLDELLRRHKTAKEILKHYSPEQLADIGLEVVQVQGKGQRRGKAIIIRQAGQANQIGTDQVESGLVQSGHAGNPVAISEEMYRDHKSTSRKMAAGLQAESQGSKPGVRVK